MVKTNEYGEHVSRSAANQAASGSSINCETVAEDYAWVFQEFDSTNLGVLLPVDTNITLEQKRAADTDFKVADKPDEHTFADAMQKLRGIKKQCGDLFQGPFMYREQPLSSLSCSRAFQNLSAVHKTYDRNHDGIFDEEEKLSLLEDATQISFGEVPDQLQPLPRNAIRADSGMDPYFEDRMRNEREVQLPNELNQVAALYEVCPSFDKNLTYETKPKWKLQVSNSKDWAFLTEDDVGVFSGLAELLPFAKAADANKDEITTPQELYNFYEEKLKPALKGKNKTTLAEHHRFVVALARLSLKLTAYGSGQSFFQEVMDDNKLFAFHQRKSAPQISAEIALYRALLPYQNILRSYDKNKDGWLVDAELQSLRNMLQSEVLTDLKKFVQNEISMVSAEAGKQMSAYVDQLYALAGLFQNSELLADATELFFENQQFGIDLDGDKLPDLTEEEASKTPGLHTLLKQAKKAESKTDDDVVTSVAELKQYYRNSLATAIKEEWDSPKKAMHDDFIAALLSASLYVGELENGYYFYQQVTGSWSINAALQHPETFRDVKETKVKPRLTE